LRPATDLLGACTLLILLLTSGLAAPRAALAAPGEVAGSLPSNGGFGLIVWGGGAVDQLVSAASVRGCAVASVWATDGASFIGYVPGAPAIVSAAFFTSYPSDIPATTPLLVVCRGAPEVAPALAPEVIASITTVQQGGATHLRVTQARAGSATLLGRTFPLTAEGDALVGYIAVGADDIVGPASVAVSFTDVAGVQRNVNVSLTVLRTEWTVDYIVLPPPGPPDPNAPPPPPDETPRLEALYRSVSPRRWQPGWQAPVDAPLDVTGYFGEQRSFNGGPVQGHHGGTDFGAQYGEPIYATNDGVVVLSELTLFRGNLVVIDHGGGVLSSYGHMMEMAVQVGDTVTRGGLVGYVGATGLATGPHLHWELAVGGVLVDGLRWLDGSQGF
jgi:hypothetical protein